MFKQIHSFRADTVFLASCSKGCHADLVALAILPDVEFRRYPLILRNFVSHPTSIPTPVLDFLLTKFSYIIERTIRYTWKVL